MLAYNGRETLTRLESDDMNIIRKRVNLHTHDVHVRRKKLQPQRNSYRERINARSVLAFFILSIAR